MTRRTRPNGRCVDCDAEVGPTAMRCVACAARNRGPSDPQLRRDGERHARRAATLTRQIDRHVQAIQALSAERREEWRLAVDECGLTKTHVRRVAGGDGTAYPNDNFYKALDRAREEHLAS